MPESARGKHATPGQAVFEGSWVVISGVISPLIWVIIMVTLLITPLITTHEPPSSQPRPQAQISTRPPPFAEPASFQGAAGVLKGSLQRVPRKPNTP